MPRTPRRNRQPSFVIVITDQQSAAPHWPRGWEEENLPAMRRLKERGVTFERAYTNSCTCSPARVTMLTSLYPAQHGVTEVLEFDNVQPIVTDVVEIGPSGLPELVPGRASDLATNVKERRQRGLQGDIQNLAKVLETAGYDVVFKGKWHLTKPVQYVPSLGQKYWTEADVDQLAERFGFTGWGFPDAGDNLAIANMGGGDTANDQRFVDGHGQAAKYGDRIPLARREEESVLHFLRHRKADDRPFCLIVSLVNPHDVLAYPGTGGLEVDGVPLYQAAGYRDEDFRDLPIDRPPTWNEDLSTKPTAQTQFRRVANVGGGPIGEDDVDLQLGYCRFYAYLCRQVDRQIAEVLRALDESEVGDDTIVVRTADHGDMAMAHGRQRQKMFNIYEETLNIPFVVAGPDVPRGARSESLVGLIDLVPTLAEIARVPDLSRWAFKGRDVTPALFHPGGSVQDVLHFTYEDLYFYVSAASHIRAIVEARWKYAVYYDPYLDQPFEYEMYDLAAPADEREVRNLGHPDTPVSEEIERERDRLHRKLLHVMTTAGTWPHEIVFPERWGEQRPGERVAEVANGDGDGTARSGESEEAGESTP